MSFVICPKEVYIFLFEPYPCFGLGIVKTYYYNGITGYEGWAFLIGCFVFGIKKVKDGDES